MDDKTHNEPNKEQRPKRGKSIGTPKRKADRINFDMPTDPKWNRISEDESKTEDGQKKLKEQADSIANMDQAAFNTRVGSFFERVGKAMISLENGIDFSGLKNAIEKAATLLKEQAASIDLMQQFYEAVWNRLSDPAINFLERLELDHVSRIMELYLDGGYTKDLVDLINESFSESGALIGKSVLDSFMKRIQSEQEQQDNIEPLAQLISKGKIETFDLPTDKVNSIVWSALIAPQEPILIGTEQHGSKNQLNIFYSIDFSDLNDVTISKSLSSYDELVYNIVAACYNNGNEVISLSQIWRAMGNSGSPSHKQIEKVNESITKMFSAHITINNGEEAKLYNYPEFKYDGSLLPMERVTARRNGKVTDAAIRIFREPPLVSFARGRKQITTLDISLLDVPISKTDKNIGVETYLLKRISRMKNNKNTSHKIMLKTLFEKTALDAKRKTRALETISAILNHYKTEGFINGFQILADSISISC